MYAAESGHTNTVVVLVKEGADVNAADKVGQINVHYVLICATQTNTNHLLYKLQHNCRKWISPFSIHIYLHLIEQVLTQLCACYLDLQYTIDYVKLLYIKHKSSWLFKNE